MPRLQSRRGRGRRPPPPEEQDVITPHTDAGPVGDLDVIHRSPRASRLGKGERNCSPGKPGAYQPPKARVLRTCETQPRPPAWAGEGAASSQARAAPG